MITIDEFGWDYDGGIDRHSAAILKAVHQKKPGLKIAVWQMRGPVAPELAAVYRDTVELVMMETYFDLKDAWMIPFQLQTARLNGLLGKTIVGLGIGKESPDLGGYPWTQTKEELDQQLRLIRFVAPESPGVAFFGLDRLGKCPLTQEQLDRICGRFSQIPTDGTGLKPELLELGKTFTRRYEKPADLLLLGVRAAVFPFRPRRRILGQRLSAAGGQGADDEPGRQGREGRQGRAARPGRRRRRLGGRVRRHPGPIRGGGRAAHPAREEVARLDRNGDPGGGARRVARCSTSRIRASSQSNPFWNSS